MRYVRKYKEETGYSGDLDRIFIDHTISGIDSPKKELVKEVKPIASYRCYDKTNDDSGRDILKDLTGNGHDIRLYNFGFAYGSGYGKYFTSFKTGGWLYTNTSGENSPNKFTITGTSNSDKKFRFFKTWVSGFRVKMTLKISGIPEQITDFCLLNESISGGSRTFLKNGINYVDEIIEESSQMNTYFIGTVPDEINNNFEITVEQIPEYKGALVSDGVDDYGVCDNFPILTKERGYTILALRYLIKDFNDKARCFLSNFNNTELKGAFQMEAKTLAQVEMVFSFGKTSEVSHIKDLFSYQTSKSYNGSELSIGTLDGYNKIHLFNYYALDSYNFLGMYALYALEIYDYDLTELEIKKAKDRLLLEYYSKTYSPIAAWSAYGKYNWGKDNNILKDITGNGHDLMLNNFSWKLDSGYGIYWADFNDWIGGNNDVFVDSRSYNSITFHYFQSSHNRVQGKIFSDKITVRVCNLNPGETVSFAYYNGNAIVYLKEGIGNGIIKIDNIPLDGLLYYFYTTQKNTPVTIEQIPEYQGSLVFDGVDDYGVCSIPELKDSNEYTIIMRRRLLDLESLNKSIVCGYGTSSGETLVYNHFWLEYLNCGWEGGKNLTSSMGDILYLKDEDIPEEITYQTSNSYNGIQIHDTGGSLEKRGDIFFLGGLGNGYNTKMAFYSAYLFDRNLTEEEIEYFIRANINKNYRLPSK